jgi:hypothetical protein
MAARQCAQEGILAEPPHRLEDSIAHLRRYSNYLAPKTGLLSADTWAYAATWCRNAFLIQLTAIVWVAFLLLLVQSAKSVFDVIGWDKGWISYIPASIMVLMVGLMMWRAGRDFLISSAPKRANETKVLLGAVAPIWIASLVAGARLWAGSNTTQGYSDLLSNSLTDKHWLFPLLAIGLGYTYVSYRSMDPKESSDAAKLKLRRDKRDKVNPTGRIQRRSFRIERNDSLRRLPSAWACVAALDLLFSAIQWVFGQMRSNSGDVAAGWYAFVFGGSGVMLASSLSVVLMIGLIGRSSEDWRREWWTRFGAWIGMFGLALLVSGSVAVFGPYLVLKLIQTSHTNVMWGTIAGWIGTLISDCLQATAANRMGMGKN